MKKVIFLFLILPYSVTAQISDDFESGNLSGWTEESAGRWKADSFESLTGSYSLHHVFDNSVSGNDCIGIPLTDFHPDEGSARWSFRVRHGYDPSASNSWQLFLMSDSDPATFRNGTQVSGYALGVNLTGYDDTLRLWKLNTGTASVVASLPLNWQNDIGTLESITINAERNQDGVWSIKLFDSAGNFKGANTGISGELFNPAWLILNYRYTSTRDRLLWLDDLKVEGTFYEDNTPPEIKEYIVTGGKSLLLKFSEEVTEEVLLPSAYRTDNTNSVYEIILKGTATYEVRFTEEFRNKTENLLEIINVCDRAGNCSSKLHARFTPAWVEPGDVVITEIMADPAPPVGLPAREYLELFNRSEFSFEASGWLLATESQQTQMPSVLIAAGDYLILCAVSDTSYFSAYGKTCGLKSFPSLNDEGRLIALLDSGSNLIHGLEYSSDWYRSDLKSTGGWSLEMIDTEEPFFTDGNWLASSSQNGGTPGSRNSVSDKNQDPLFYGIVNVYATDSISVKITLSETVPEILKRKDEIFIDEEHIKSAFQDDILLQRLNIVSPKKLRKNEIHTLSLPADLPDFSGNEITKSSFRFGMPERSIQGDIVFNELLFNPLPEEPDYIEFYNNSEHIIDMSELLLASVSSENGDTSSTVTVSEETRLLLPGEYYAVTTNCTALAERYPSSDKERIFNSSSLPSMPDEKGHLLLLTRELQLIDEVIYCDDMHFPLFSGNEGISLEKIRPGLPSNESKNWHSASESSGWGTPGKVNSVFSPSMAGPDILTFSSRKISPDNDGYEDVLIIDIDPVGADNVVTVTVFDEIGRYVRRVAENCLAGEKASIVWDATADNGSLVEQGIYVFLIELYNSRGMTSRWKRVCTVVR